MISYELYKFIHLVSVIFLFASLGMLIMGGLRSKHLKVMLSVSLFFVFLGGMGLMARIGISHGELWPIWLLVKFAIWAMIILGVTLAWKLRMNKVVSFYCLMILGALAIYFAINKPFYS